MSVPFYDKIDIFVPVGGPAVTVSDTTNSVGWYWSNGSPEAAVSAPVGSICSDYSGGNLYKKSSGVGNTGWTALAAGSGTTNLGLGTNTSTTLIVTSSTGNSVTLPSATGSLAGLLPAVDKTKLNYITVTQAVDLDTIESEGAALVTLSGVTSGSTHLGTFSGTTITNSSTIKSALQLLETAVESRISETNLSVVSRTNTALTVASDTGTDAVLPLATNTLAGIVSGTDYTYLSNLITFDTINLLDSADMNISSLAILTGVTKGSVNLGTFTGSTIADSTTIKAALQSLETAVETKLASSLTNGRIFIGNVSNVATGVAMSGDVSITNTGSTTVVTGTSSVAGKLRLATNAEVLAGVLTTVASTPKGISDYIVALIGNSVGVANLGSFTGSTISAGSSVKSALQQIVTKLEGLVSGLQFTGTWDATTASPVAGMANNTFKRISVAGTTSIVTENFGTVTEWAVGDYLMKASNGSVHKIDNTDVPVNLGIASITHTTLDITSSTGSNTTVPQAIASSSATSSSGKAGLVTGNDKFKIENTGGYQTLYGGATSNTITHNLGTKNVTVAVYRVSDDVQVFPTIVATSNSVVTITHSIAPSASSFRAVVSRVAV